MIWRIPKMKRLCLVLSVLSLGCFVGCADRDGPTEPGDAYYLVSSVPTIGYVNDVIVHDGYAYTATGEMGLSIINVSDSESPELVAQYDLPQGYSKGVELLVKGDRTYAFVTAGGYVGLMVVDVTNPENPTFKSVIGGDDPTGADYVESYENCALVDTMIYIADRSGGLVSFDIRHIEDVDPHFEHRLRTPGYARSVCVRDSIIYVAVGENGLATVRHDPEKTSGVLELLDTADTPDYAYDVAVSEDLIAYVADNAYGIRVFDVSDPWNIVEIGWGRTPGNCKRVFIHRELLLVADGFEGLAVLDISDPSRPTMVGQYVVKDVESVWADDDHIYVGTEHDGLLLLNW
jgi:hypothetical protein